MPVQLDHQSILQEIYMCCIKLKQYITTKTGISVKQGYCTKFIGGGEWGREGEGGLRESICLKNEILDCNC